MLVAESARPILPWAFILLITGAAVQGAALFEHLPGLPKQSRLRRISEFDPEVGPGPDPEGAVQFYLRTGRCFGHECDPAVVTEVSLCKSISTHRPFWGRRSGRAHSVRLPLDFAFTPPKWCFNDICPAINWNVRFHLQLSHFGRHK